MTYRNKFLDNTALPTCLAPWHTLTVKWGGNVVPDIIYKNKLGNINKQTLQEILSGAEAQELRTAHRNRQIPDVCKGCASKEKSGRSRRIFVYARNRPVLSNQSHTDTMAEGEKIVQINIAE